MVRLNMCQPPTKRPLLLMLRFVQLFGTTFSLAFAVIFSSVKSDELTETINEFSFGSVSVRFDVFVVALACRSPIPQAPSTATRRSTFSTSTASGIRSPMQRTGQVLFGMNIGSAVVPFRYWSEMLYE